MIFPDLNLLIHAHNPRSQVFQPAKIWLEKQMNGSQSIYFAWPVLIGFVRITTLPRILLEPLTPEDSFSRVEEWLSRPHVHLINPSPTHFSKWKQLLLTAGAAGNLTTDAHLAVMAIERGLILHTTDTDFGRFPGLKWVNPLLE
jgi:uncharacterized protein